MQDDWFENKMNERLEDFDSELNLEAAWDELEARRDPEKQNRKGLIWWWTGTAFAVLSIAVLFFINSSPTLEYGNFIAKNTTESKGSNLWINSSGDSKSPNEYEFASTNLPHYPTEKIGHQLDSPTSPTLKKQVNIQEEKKKAAALPIKTKENNSNILKNEIKKNISKKSTITLEKENKKALSSFKNDSPVVQKEEQDKVLSPISKNKSDYSKNQNLFNPKPLAKLESQIQFLKTNESISTDIPDFYQEEKSLDEIEALPKSKMLKNTFGISYAYGKAFRATPRGRSNSNYTILRSKNETILDAWSAQLFFERKIKNAWFMRFDAGFLSTTDLFKDETILTSPKIFENQVLQINRFVNGTESQIIGSAIGSETRTTTGNYYQRYRSAFLGFSFGHQRNLTKSLSLRASVGTNFTVFRANNGFILNPTQVSNNLDNLSNFANQNGSLLAGKVRIEIGKVFKNSHELSFGILGKAELTDIKNHQLYVGKRQYLLSEFSYRKSF